MKTKSSLLPASFSTEKLQCRLNTLLETMEQNKQNGEMPSQAIVQEAADLTRFYSDWALAHCLTRGRFGSVRERLAKEALRLEPLLRDI